MYLTNGLDFEKSVDVFVLALGAIAVADLLGVFDRRELDHGLYVPEDAIEQADLGREVTIERIWGPDFVLALEEDA